MKFNSNIANLLHLFACLVIIMAGLKAGKIVFVPLLFAAFLTIILLPFFQYLQKKGFHAFASILVILMIIPLPFGICSSLIIHSVKKFREKVPEYKIKLKHQREVVISQIEKFGIKTKVLKDFFDPSLVIELVTKTLNELGKLFANSLLISVIVIFMLLEASRIKEKLEIIQLTHKSGGDFGNILKTVQNYIFIKSLFSLLTGMIVWLFLTILKVDYPALWGLFAFLFNFVPNIGSTLAAIPPILLSGIQFGLLWAVIVAIAYFIINNVISNLVEPRFLGTGLGLSPLIVFLSLFFWGWIFGPIGMLLAVPLTITIKIGLNQNEETRWLSVLIGT
ncbi:AI-2E family transporter [Candidatus Riflebacteria bacterium]